jgi:flagellar basal body-associated protein FliL
LDLSDIIKGFSLGDALLIALVVVTLLVLVLFFRVLGRSGKGEARTPSEVLYEEPVEALPSEEPKTAEEEIEIEEPVEHEPELTDMEPEVIEPKEEPEIRPITAAIEIKSVEEPGEEIRPLLEEESDDRCQYCSVFLDLGTAVCPNCGRPLDARITPKA